MTITGLIRKGTIVFAAPFLAFALAACEEQGSIEQTGETIGGSVEKSADMIEQEAQQVQEGAAGLEESVDPSQENAQ